VDHRADLDVVEKSKNLCFCQGLNLACPALSLVTINLEQQNLLFAFGRGKHKWLVLQLAWCRVGTAETVPRLLGEFGSISDLLDTGACAAQVPATPTSH